MSEPRKILIIWGKDQEKIWREFLEEENSFELTEVNTWEESQEILNQQKFDFVIVSPDFISLDSSFFTTEVHRRIGNHLEDFAARLSILQTENPEFDLVEAKIVINGIELQQGDIGSLPDFYESPESIRAADKSELQELIELFQEEERQPDLISDERWNNATDGRYAELSLKNGCHFARSNEALIEKKTGKRETTEDHISAWKKYHAQALDYAIQAGVTQDRNQKQLLWEKAILYNAFAEHFLMDAFSAGHMFNKEDLVAVVKKNTKRSQTFKESLKNVAQEVFEAYPNYLRKFKIIPKAPLGCFLHPNIENADRFAQLLNGIYQKRPDVIYNTIAKIAHDKLGEKTLKVKNVTGEWDLKGGGMLELLNDPKTEEFIIKAMVTGRCNLVKFAENASKKTGVSLDKEIYFQEVLQYFPILTDVSQQEIHELLATITDPNNMKEYLVEVLKGNIKVLMNALMHEGYIRKIPR